MLRLSGILVALFLLIWLAYPGAAAVSREPLDQLRAQTRIFVGGDGSRFLEAVELLDLVRDAEADHPSKFVACLLSLLDGAVRHASSLEDQIGEHTDVGSQDHKNITQTVLPKPEMS